MKVRYENGVVAEVEGTAEECAAYERGRWWSPGVTPAPPRLGATPWWGIVPPIDPNPPAPILPIWNPQSAQISWLVKATNNTDGQAPITCSTNHAVG